MPKFLGLMLAVSAMSALFSTPVTAAVEAVEPAQLIQAVASSFTEIVKTKTGADRETAMRAVLRQNFDLPRMVNDTFGQHWVTASARQKARLLAAFEASEAHAYGERLANLPGVAVTVGTATPRAPGVWMVDSRLVLPNGRSLKLDWEVREGPQGMLISDIRVLGVSMFVTKRADFEAFIQDHGGTVEPLIEVLEARASR